MNTIVRYFILRIKLCCIHKLRHFNRILEIFASNILIYSYMWYPNCLIHLGQPFNETFEINTIVNHIYILAGKKDHNELRDALEVVIEDTDVLPESLGGTHG